MNRAEIIRQIEKNGQEHLDNLARAGVPRDHLVRLIAQLTLRGEERMLEKDRELLRDHREETKRLSSRIEKLAKTIRRYAEEREHPEVVYTLDSIKANDRVLKEHLQLVERAKKSRRVLNPHSNAGKTVSAMESLAAELKASSRCYGSYLKVYSQADRGIDFLLDWIVNWCEPSRKHWDALAQLMPKRCRTREGTSEMTWRPLSDRMRKRAERLRKGLSY